MSGLTSCWDWVCHFATYVMHRAWLLEIAFLLCAASFFALLWWTSRIADTPVSQYIQTTWAILPVLAVTNALPMLGVSVFLGRYTISDKPSEALAGLSALVRGDFNRIYGHPRANPFRRRAVYRATLRRAKTGAFLFEENGEPLYTIRPYWDGIWFFGSSAYVKNQRAERSILYPTHELLFCAIVMLRIVAVLRASGSYSLGRRGRREQGSQGSYWFLEDFVKTQKLLTPPIRRINIHDAQRIIYHAIDSTHYMTEELQAHEGAMVRDERRDTMFIHYMCDYIIWMDFFHNKLMECRVAFVRRRIAIEKLQPYFEKTMGGYQAAHEGVINLRTANLVRMVTAERIHQVKLGTIIPILTTAGALLTYICLQPLAYGLFDHWYARTVAGVAYVIAATSIGMNLAFGVWLLISAPQSRRADLMY